jgi:FMN-dependent oxidoreductase (nitrilotriacetate monooxygenase family)
VTSWSDAEAHNFGRESHLEHATRYRRAHEFVDVVTGLWDSWEDDAFIREKESGIFFDPDKLHILNYKGQFLKVKGPLNVARPPQGYPVIVQAGSSDDGQELAARTSEVIFTAQQSLADAQNFYRELKGRLAKYGRTPDQLLVMPGIFPVVGRSQQEAQDKFDQLQNLIAPEIGLNLLKSVAPGPDLSQYDIDKPLPKDLGKTNGSTSRQALLLELAARENLTIRQLYLRVAAAIGAWLARLKTLSISWKNGSGMRLRTASMF